MKKFRVLVTSQASEEIRQTLRFISAHSKEQGGRWGRGVAAAIRSLSSMPERCPLARETQLGAEPELRQLMFLTHRIVYRIDLASRTVIVLHVRHGSRLAAGEAEDE